VFDARWQYPDAAVELPDWDAAPEEPVLRIDYLDPDHGPFTGGTETVIRGRGFTEDMTIEIGGLAVETLDIVFIDDRRVTIRTPPGTPGPAEVRVQAGDLTATLPDGFLYEAITVDPPSGAVSGGTYVRIRGFGTAFVDGDIVTFDGVPLNPQTVISPVEIAGFTPAGVPGTADVEVNGPSGTIVAEDAYTYTNGADPFNGGMGGGPINGAVNVTVLDWMTQDGIDGAFVALGDPATGPTGTTDPFGQITFSTPGLVGPVTVTAAAAGYESSAMVVFDAQDVSIFLYPIPEPQPGPFPPGRAAGYINGHIVFGDATGIGTTGWSLVPEPRNDNELKRAYVYTTVANPFSGNPDPGPTGIIDYEDDGATSWEFSIVARPAALAVVAVAGLYDPTIDPDGEGPLPLGLFTPFAMGVERGVLVGPGESVDNIAVIVDIPLDTTLNVQFQDAPPLFSPGWYGPTQYEIEAYVDLGGEGVIVLPGNSAVLPFPAVDGMLTSMAPLSSRLADASYIVFAGAYSPFGSNPWSVRVLKGITDVGVPIVATDFLGTPRPFDPPSGGIATSQHLQIAPEGGTGEPTFHMHILSGFDGTPYWRIFARGTELDVDLPDLQSAAGLPGLPPNTQVIWTCYSITVPGLTFDNFNYGHLNANYWTAYAADAWVVQFPAP
jgi:hypothetical protein